MLTNFDRLIFKRNVSHSVVLICGFMKMSSNIANLFGKLLWNNENSLQFLKIGFINSLLSFIQLIFEEGVKLDSWLGKTIKYIIS